MWWKLQLTNMTFNKSTVFARYLELATTSHNRTLFWSKNDPTGAQKTNKFGSYEIVFPLDNTKNRLQVPDHVVKPSYAETGEPTEIITQPEVKNAEQIAKMRNACKLAANILNRVSECFKKNKVTTDDINKFVHDLTIKHGAYPSPLNYKHFPKSVCTSVNNIACHGIPDERCLDSRDIITVDVTVYYDGFHGDCSKTFIMSDADDLARDLVKANEICLNEAIGICKPGQKFSNIGKFIEERAKSLGYKVVPCFLGHGIGHYFHGPPDIFHTRNNYPGEMLAGMTFTIEPLLTQGSQDIVILEDDWSAATEDDARTAQFEHTVLITETGVEILTLPD